MKGILFALLLVISLFLVMTLVNATDITTCVEIASPGFYNITQNITNAVNSECIVIGSNNITLEGNGFTINGVNGTLRNAKGVYINYVNSNITVQNISFINWERGIYLLGASNITIQNCNFPTNLTYGIYLASNSNNDTLFNNFLGGTTSSGIYIASSNNDNLSYNNITSPEVGGIGAGLQYGLTFTSSDNNTVVGNRLTTMNFSMTFTNSDNNTVRNNVIENSLSAGFLLTNSDSTTLIGNELIDCQAAGFELINSYFNNLTGNIIDNVTNSGFKLTTSHNNSISLNNITNLKSSGINLSLSNYNNITDNEFTNPEPTISATGISLYSSLNNRINGNNINNLTSGGLYLKDSNGNQLMNNSFYVPRTINSVIAIWFLNSSNNNVSDGLFSGGLITTMAAYPMILLENGSNYNKIENVIITISYAGVSFSKSNNNTVSGINIWAINPNIELVNASNNTFENSNFSRYSYSGSPYFYKSDSNSLRNRGTNVLFNSTSGGLSGQFLNKTYVDFFGDNFDFRESNISYWARGWIGKVFLLTIRGLTGPNTIEFNVSYTNADLANYYIDNESSLKMKYYSSGWNNITLSGVNETENYVWSMPSSTTFSTEKPIAPFGHADYPPEVNLIYPANNEILGSGEINFSFNVTDDVSDIFNCSLYLDDSLNATNSTTINATTTYFNITGISYGNHEWFVNCSDETNQTNVFETRSFTVGSFVSDCGVLNSAGRTYLMNGSLHSATTCFTISADNITLNCVGYDISYGEGGVSGYAVTSTPPRVGLTVKNCNITEGSLSGNSKNGIYFITSNNSYINNNTITLIGAISRGVYLQSGDYNEVYDNIIISTGLTASKGILFSANSFGIIRNNTIQVTGTSNVGILLQGTNSSNLTSNILTASGSGSCGIQIQGGNNILDRNNFTESAIGLKLDQSDNILIENDFNNTKISFSQYSGTFKISRASEFPSNPAGVAGILKYVNITNTSAGNWINLTMHYNDDELGAVNESALETWRYNGTNWTSLTSGVNITGNYVYSNLTNFSTFGLFGDEYDFVDPPENLSIFLMDDDTNNVFLNWSEVSGATGYYIWYSNNVTWVLQLNETNSTPANQTLIGSTNITWNDTTANLTTRRFYAVASYVGGLKNLSYNRTGKFDIEIENSTNDPSSNEGSIVSFPLGPLNGNLSYVLNLSGAHAFYDRIRIYNSSSSLWIQAEYLGNGIWDNNKFLIEPGRGYWFTKVNGSYNLTNVGIVPRGNLTIFINQSENNPSTKEGSLLGWTLLTDANLSTELNLSGAHAFYDRIRIYNSSSSLWIQAEYLGNGIWDNNKFLIEPGRGYWFTKTNESYNWTQERPV